MHAADAGHRALTCHIDVQAGGSADHMTSVHRYTAAPTVQVLSGRRECSPSPMHNNMSAWDHAHLS